MSVANSYPVRFDLVEVTETVGPYQKGETWAEPSVEDATRRMREVFACRSDAAARGEAARRDIGAGYSAAAVSRLIGSRLAAIALRRRFGEFRDEMETRYRLYRKLPDQVREAARSAAPPGATVAVVSKGDPDLVDLDGQTGWHFPRDEDGAYSGYYPADGRAAVEHLEALRHRGAGFLVLPRTAFWWLDHYPELRFHLEGCYARAWCDDHCLIYRLTGALGDGR